MVTNLSDFDERLKLAIDQKAALVIQEKFLRLELKKGNDLVQSQLAEVEEKIKLADHQIER